MSETRVQQSPQSNAAGVTLTAGAAAHLRRQMEKAESPPLGVRIGIRKTGCSGLAYVVDLVHEARPDDSVFPQPDGLEVYVDSKSLAVVDGTHVDYTIQGLSQMLRFRNPNVVSECGCGESFSVA